LNSGRNQALIIVPLLRPFCTNKPLTQKFRNAALENYPFRRYVFQHVQRDWRKYYKKRQKWIEGPRIKASFSTLASP
jgi:hypothetical protein